MHFNWTPFSASCSGARSRRESESTTTYEYCIETGTGEFLNKIFRAKLVAQKQMVWTQEETFK